MQLATDPILLAMLAAVCIGFGDFLGGRASERAGTAITVTIAQLVAAALMAAILFSGDTRWPSGNELAVSVAVGLIDGVGLLALYHGLGYGRIGIVAPLAGVTAVVIPVVLEIIFLRALPPLGLAGIVLAILALLGLSRSKGSDGEEKSTPEVFRLSWLMGGASGVIFGIVGFVIGLFATETAPATLAVLRIVAAAVAFVALLRTRHRVSLTLPSFGLIVAAGLLDGTAMLSYLNAASQGLIGIASAVLSLNIGIIVLLGYFVLGQRIDRWQTAGLLLGGAAITLLAAAHE